MTRRTNSSRWSAASCAGLLAVLLATPALGVVIPGHPDDGRIRDGVVNTTMEEIGVGHYADTNAPPNMLGSTAIFFFELPDPSKVGAVHSATLSFTLNDKSGSFVTNPANADIWGVGYVSSTTIQSDWHLAGDNDASIGENLGGSAVVKIANDIMTRHTYDPSDVVPSRLVAADLELADFLNLCYDNGAVSGSYAVIRMNIDEPTSSLNRRYDVASADDPSPDAHPVLSINENTPLLWDPFDDGSRREDVDPFDTTWWRVNSGATNSVADDSAGIGSGNALFTQMYGSKNRFVGSFPKVTLSEPGDFVQLTMKIRPVEVFITSDGTFRFALMSNEPPIGGDTTSTTGLDYPGYMLKTSTGGSLSDLSLVQLVDNGNPALLGGDQEGIASEAGAISLTAPNVYTLLFSVTRASTDRMHVRVVLNDVVLTGGETYVSLSDATFNMFGFGCNPSGQLDFFADDILVETSVPLFDVAPHDETLADAVRMEFESLDSVEYVLQEANDLAEADWVETGYTLIGNGQSMSLYDPSTDAADKAYRLGGIPAQGVEIFTETIDTNVWNVKIFPASNFPVIGNAISNAPTPFMDGDALRIYDLTSANKPELVGELSDTILEPFLVSFQSYDLSVGTNNGSAIRFRMGNSGKALTSGNRTALSLSWYVGGEFTASYDTGSNVSSITSAPLTNGVYDIVMVGNGSTSEDYSYSLSAGPRTLAPLSYDIYIDGALLNNPTDFPNVPAGGLPFALQAHHTEYDPLNGLRRFSLLGSSSSDMGADCLFDNVFLSVGVIEESRPFTSVARTADAGFSFLSEAGLSYRLQASTNATDRFSVWTDTGMGVLGDGTTKVLFDAGGYDPARTYRVVESD